MTFTEWLDERMRENNLSISALARAMHVSTATVSAWRAGRREPVPATLRDLAVLFKASPDDAIALTKWREGA